MCYCVVCACRNDYLLALLILVALLVPVKILVQRLAKRLHTGGDK